MHMQINLDIFEQMEMQRKVLDQMNGLDNETPDY